MLEFSRKLRVYLAENNIKKKDFAVEIGVSPETISNWLHQGMRPSFDHALKIDSATKGVVAVNDMGY